MFGAWVRRHYSKPVSEIAPFQGGSTSDCVSLVEEQTAPKRSSMAEKKKKRKLKNESSRTAVSVVSKGTLTAEVFIKGHPRMPKVEPAEADEIGLGLDRAGAADASERSRWATRGRRPAWP